MKGIVSGKFVTVFDSGIPKYWDNKPTAGLSDEELYSLGFREVIFPDKSENEKYENPIWDDENDVITHPISALTTDEITQRNENIAIEKKRVRNEKIATLESKGVFIEHKDNTFHFTREMATQLIAATQLSEKLSAKTLEWENKEGEFVTIKVIDSYKICGEVMQKFIAIRKEC